MLRLLSKQRNSVSLFHNPTKENIIRASVHSGDSVRLPHDVYTPNPLKYQVTKLESGITVLTESIGVPARVEMGIFVDLGTRDETPELSGSTLLLKNAFLKTHIRTNETVNYGVAQMAGGELQMDYTRENIFARASCLAHDAVDVFSVLADCSFEPRNMIAANVGMYKNQETHKMQGAQGFNTTFNDTVYSTAFGTNTLGMPLLGRKGNINYLSSEYVQKFQAHVVPNRVIISATGVEFHKEFVELVQEKLYDNVLSQKEYKRVSSQYRGGEIRDLIDSSSINIVLAFQGADIRQAYPLLLAKEILDQTRKAGRIQKSVMKNVFIENAQVFNASYTDNGIFGLKITGSASHGKQIIEAAAKELNKLQSITPAELELAKQSLKGKFLRNEGKDWKRLEDRVKNLFYFGSADANHFKAIEEVKVEQVTAAVKKSLKTPLTFVARGGEANHLPSYDAISKLFASN